MNYDFREREAQWSDLALLCCDMKTARKLRAGRCPRGGQVEVRAGALVHQALLQIFMCSDLQVSSSTTLLEASAVVSEVTERH